MMTIEIKWYIDEHLPFYDRKMYQQDYLETYRAAADCINEHIEDLNNLFKEEVGEMENYNNPTYNNWMAVHMTAILSQNMCLRCDWDWDFIYYNSDLVLVCSRGRHEIRMELVPGTEKYL